ncbi:hypothetical protein CRI94_09330 [Longibacter salinarum]|uniref:Uncharacterized protein n=1 Tax=Longibacter salinarum TaxID=1850348 RepID=A0A2A8CY49_9BACT|nr:carboxypeptidase-like regulatory domain-containing protein [Longibacter salinarum]PEN13507.1 hypothetical protein CRI94_09330 [Longibacter salinarum]
MVGYPRWFCLWTWVILLGVLGTVQSAHAQTTSVRDAIETLEATTAYRFLYRDAVVAGHQVTVDLDGASAEGNVEALAQAVRSAGLNLRIDHDRQQVIITSERTRRATSVEGYVLDGRTGTRLPLATVLWRGNDGRQGTATDADGRFRIRLGDNRSSLDTLVVRVSYVGYSPRTVHIPLSPAPDELPIRLTPRQTQAPEVIVQTKSIVAGLDTTWQDLVRAERYAPLGESNVLRALQPLPSIGTSGAITGGLVVRGSRPDGFRVLLDGAPVYNAHHLFGMYDAFNADALQTVALFYDVAPATYAAPPGGTLAFRTRTGSQTDVRTTLNASTSAVSGTVEVPWDQGRGSVLVSARRSTLDALEWFDNERLIEIGLDVDRPREPLPSEALGEIGARTRRSLDPSASFYDVHINAHNERASGRRVSMSLYAGRDNADQGLLRLVRNPSDASRFAIDTTRTSDRWGNTSGSVQLDEPLSERAYGRLTVAGSRYFSRYQKDDFFYSRRRPNGENQFFLDAYANENTLYEWTVEPRVDLALPNNGIASVGAAAYLYDVEYEESSALAPRFELSRQATRLDLYAHLEASPEPVHVSLGLRAHAYSLGNIVRISPRMQVRVFPERTVSFGAGYTRSHQFLHRIDIVGETSSAIWVPSTKGQPPGRVDHLSTGMYISPSAGPAIQVEAYIKAHENVRIHETIARLRPGDQTVLFAPWTVKNTSRARGLEVLARQRLGPVSVAAGYTWSRVDIDRLGREAQPAPWDRRHQLTSRIDLSMDGWSAALTGTYATGTPSDYARIVDQEPKRIGETVRMDATVQYERAVGSVNVRVRGAVYNLLDANNPWYRTPALFWTRPGGRATRLESSYAILDTYDLGFQPSVAIHVAF